MKFKYKSPQKKLNHFTSIMDGKDEQNMLSGFNGSFSQGQFSHGIDCERAICSCFRFVIDKKEPSVSSLLTIDEFIEKVEKKIKNKKNKEGG